MHSYTETEQLDVFLDRAEALSRISVIRNNELQNKLSFSWNAAQSQLKVDSWRPDEESLDVFMHRFRHFWAQEEPGNVKRIANIVWNRVESDRVREQLKLAKQQWKNAQRQGHSVW